MARLHGRKVVSADPDKCIGCCVCEYACSMVKEKTFNPTKARIRAIRIGSLVNLAIACRLCEDPPCVAACPRDALSQEEKTGIIMIDEDKCNGCGWCIEACDYGAIMLHPETKVVYVCDTCKDLDKPQCIEWCPEEALDFVTLDVLAQKARKTAVMKLFEESVQEE